jgi:2-oxoglutarate dehydrogenase E1 component
MPASMSIDFVEALYAQFLQDPQSVSADWRAYFQQFQAESDRVTLGPSFSPPSIFHGGHNGSTGGTSGASGGGGASDAAYLQDRVDQMVRAYRVRGHMIAQIDPLGLPRNEHVELDPKHYHFTDTEWSKPVSSMTVAGANVRTLREVFERMRNTYCRSIGVQFMHIDDVEIRGWLTERMESTENRIQLSRPEQLRILTRLTDAVLFEQFLHTKYVGAKTFSLEGGESLIPLMDLAIEKAADQGVKEVVIGMAHRGRLNVLANIMGKPLRQIFREFEDLDPSLYQGAGDVKYHLGYSSDWMASNGKKVHLSLCFNPSHLEFINPVAQGRVRGKQDRVGDKAREQGMALLIHGDAAFAGEGVVQESLNLAELEAYKTGGTLHVVVNNQIGFTTDWWESRSSTYATDVAKMLQSPIFHVNGEDPEAVAQVVQLAMDFRKKFKRDVVIDMYCYRLYGHNEGDEPTFTQPLMYKAIKQRKTVRDSYLERLINHGNAVTKEEADRIAAQRSEHMEKELAVARSSDYKPTPDTLRQQWSGYLGGPFKNAPQVNTGVAAERLSNVLQKLTTLPEGFKVHPKIARFLESRREMAAGKRGVDWATGEALAMATLALQGVRVRLSGQDSIRGTFTQRHAGLTDFETGKRHLPIQHISPDQAPVEIYNSALSETAVMGFEYGYSLDWPDGLVMWEAQFGDFVNVAQVIIDQFLVSAEDKWRRLSGLVLLLPHGYEGAGPEHSSARLERFLNLCAEDNMQVVYPSTPANYFHILRRQVMSKWRKPLVVMTPKSLLRNPKCVSPLADFEKGRVEMVIGDAQYKHDVSQIILCSGKVYYDLVEHREKLNRQDVAIVRLEQLYPFPEEELRDALAGYADGTPVTFVQEEPENMGAWRFFRHCAAPYGKLFNRFPVTGVTRLESASPATGSHSAHDLEQEDLLERAFDVEQPARAPQTAGKQ